MNKILKILKNTSIAKKIYQSPKALEFFESSFWSVSGAILSKGLLFLAWILVARLLGSDGYGQFGIVRSTVLMFAAFAGFSLGLTASKYIAEYSKVDKDKTSRILGLTIIFGTLMGGGVGVTFYFLSPWLAESTLNAPEIIKELRISSLILFFSALNGAQMGALQGFLAFKRIAIINVLQSVISFPLFIVGALYFGVYGTIWAFAFSYILICVFSHFELKKVTKSNKIVIDYKNAWEEKQILISYSFPAFLSGLMVVPIKWVADSLLVSRGGFNEMGQFTAALTFNNIILVGVGMLSAPFIAIMARNKNDSIDSRFSRFNILAPWAIGIYFCVPFIVFPEIGEVMFGEAFSNRSFKFTFVLVLLFTILVMFKQGLSRIIAVYDLQWWAVLDNLIWGATLIVTFLLFSKQNSMFLALSYLIAYTINIILIIPLYFFKNIIPKGTIISIESFLIWCIVLSMTYIGIYLESYAARFVILLFALFLFSFLFKRIFNLKNTN